MKISEFIKSPVRISDSGRIRTKFSDVVDVKNAEINKLTEKVEQQAALIADLKLEVAARDMVLNEYTSIPDKRIAYAKAEIEKEKGND